MKKICYVTGGVLYWICVISLIVNLVLFLTGIRPYIVVSGSMEPAIRTGSVTWVNTRISTEELREGEILAFWGNQGGMVLHRIVEVRSEGFVTKGDANDVPDSAIVLKEQVRGKAVFSLPWLGYLLPDKGKVPALFFLAGSIMLACIMKKTRKTGEK